VHMASPHGRRAMLHAAQQRGHSATGLPHLRTHSDEPMLLTPLCVEKEVQAGLPEEPAVEGRALLA